MDDDAITDGELSELLECTEVATVAFMRGETDRYPELTQVYRRVEGEWLVVHRRADPLVHPVDLDGAAALARG